MDARDPGLRSELEELRRRVTELEQRLALLEGGALASAGAVPVVDARPRPVGEPEAVPDVPVARIMAAAGRLFLILGGAFLLRALTDNGVLSPEAGVGAGLVYALAWLPPALRSARRDQRLEAVCYGLVALMIALPLIWETAVYRKIASPDQAAAMLAVVVTAVFLTAWAGRLQPVAWATTLGTLVLAPGLAYATHHLAPFVAVSLLLGGLTTWVTFALGWRGKRWLAAASADIGLLQIAFLAGGASRLYVPVSGGTAQLLCLLALPLYLGSFIVRSIVKRRAVTAFEVAQTVGVILTGFGGAVRIAHQQGIGTGWLGIASVVVGLTGYGISFTYVRGRHGRGRNFFYHAWLAFVMTVVGVWLLSSGRTLALVWSVMAVVAAVLGARYGRVTLALHAAAYTLLAAWVVGLPGAAFQALLGVQPLPWSPAQVLVLAVALTVYAVLTTHRIPVELTWTRRLPRFLVLLLAAAGTAGLPVMLVGARLAGGHPGGSELCAVTRLGVLALAAVGLAAGGRRERYREWQWLVYPLLLVAAVRLLAVDMRHVPASGLFPEFLLLGAALILAPRLLHARPPDAG